MNPLISTCLFAAFGCVLSMGHAVAAEPAETSPPASPLPVTLTLDKPGFVTAVIERADGRRVHNLVSEDAGENDLVDGRAVWAVLRQLGGSAGQPLADCLPPAR